MEKYSCYKFEIKKVMDMSDFKPKLSWIYIIYGSGCPPYYDGKIESDDLYDTEQEARYAAIGHITLLENGEG